jgi:hypothetical protein
MTARELCRRAPLNPESLRRLTRADLIPATGKPRGSWPTYGEDALLLAKVAAAFVRLGAAAMDAQTLLLTLLAMPPSDREGFARRVVLMRTARETSRVDWALEGDQVLMIGDEPLLVPLRDILDQKPDDPPAIYMFEIPVFPPQRQGVFVQETTNAAEPQREQS